ncbi:MAG: NAD(P)H-quinone oxidoreductase [Actinomycetota bacterium]|nr:NAD(P)H-quinone oxidoreductase [Actinomycetota bacterium]MEC9425237.1 NAD(P)H-quinone oxidoreductase [Actinomycetota bacterium]MEC9467090.1 NAD(P)H-quinone oxidoreductase [Actinomycetota bacterium]MED6327726.1 NAD(P)H-quinone oxidoreductase [Actinomycetota bacterium]MEE2958629.1 NAD(P)H-quinone oxidoreductase [Actinomycetota bacterium]
MRAVVLDGYGSPEVLAVRDLPDPVPGSGEVLVEVAATALNRADLLQRMGLYPGPPMDYEIPGLEFAGRVAALGEGCSRWSVGDAVMGIVGGGGYAEKLVVHEDQAVRVPDGLPLVVAGGLAEVFVTAWDALVLQGGLMAGGTALVHAGASGVGTAAIQLCGLVGAEVVATASAGKLEVCRDLGASLAVDRATEGGWATEVVAHAPEGIDVVLDVVGGDYLEQNVECLATGGTIVQVGVMGGGRATFTLAKMLSKKATLVGTTLRSRSLDEKVAVSRAFENQVVPGFEDGRLRVVVDRRFGLDEVAEAHSYLETNVSVGKVLIEVSPE